MRINARFAGIEARGARGEILTAPRVDAINSFEAPNLVVPKPFAGKAEKGAVTLDLPGKSVMVVQIES